jgi:N-acetylglucosamine kinase-like BadF-type ATPase
VQSNQYYLGIDGGQSSTIALIADESGCVLGCGRGGPCNHATGEAGRQKFFGAVTGCLEQAAQEAGLDLPALEFEAACLGFSGGAADKEAYSRELIRSRRFEITHDAMIALAGAQAGEPGIIIISGTGSMAFGRNAAGKTARAGGWGYVFGDEGGGFDITRQALRAALRMEEGWGPETALRAALLQKTGAADADALLHRFYTPDVTRQSIAALSKLVADAAEEGDEVARSILRKAAEQLSAYVDGVAQHLFSAQETVSVAYVGGGFQSDLLRETFVESMTARRNCVVKKPLMSPAAGALLTALRIAGNPANLKSVPEAVK